MDLTTLTDAEARDLLAAVYADVQRRETIAAAPARAADLAAQYAQAIGRHDGDAWQQPVGAHDALPLGAIVTHDGKLWESLIPANVWQPGVTGWREIVDEGSGPAAWVQPLGAHDSYPLGARVVHNGRVWESQHAANVWAPPALWTDIGPA